MQPETARELDSLSPAKLRILDAAEDLFAVRGYAATSIVDIAEAIGVRGPAIYKHYGSKAEVYDAVIDRLFSPMKVTMEQMRSPEGAGSSTLLEQLVRHHIDHPNIPRLIQQATLSSGEQLEKLIDNWYRPFFTSLPDTDESAKPLIMAFHSMLLGYITLAPLHARLFDVEPLSEEQLAEHLALLARLAADLQAG